ncbi:hypothetical protein GCM10010331_75240 [Streptomyces xanthochromogenes]|uniref:hypothetical protein n=1 Tax=Streptomyces xanthochromogenes TaxID=67384 RepID=UPI0016773A7D|nr:hypothetical protein [Streptomyces xanthochromogenes]GHB76281.1 hypothetical protein GCM10010331_75240 [Streptomyces xanthochromogenes]
MHQEVNPPESPPGASTDGVVWLRPEYQGRQGELVTLAAGARLVGVSAAAVSNWQNRYPETFPRLALLTGPPHKRTKWVVTVELVGFARDQRTRERDRSGPRSPQRPGAEIAAEQTAHYEEVLRTLTEREDRQAKALARTRAAKRAADQKLARARARLAAEVDAVARLGTQRDHRTMTTEEECRP